MQDKENTNEAPRKTVSNKESVGRLKTISINKPVKAFDI